MASIPKFTRGGLVRSSLYKCGFNSESPLCAGDLASAGATHSDGTPLSKPGTGIPRILHQTYNTSDIPDSLKQNMESWDAKNPGWDMRFYNDTQCLELVERDFPQYAPAYKALPKPVEKADFFRWSIHRLFSGAVQRLCLLFDAWSTSHTKSSARLNCRNLV